MPPFCIKCMKFMRCAKNGDFLAVGFDGWRACDRYACSCGAEVLSGFASNPDGEVFTPDQKASLEANGHTFWKEA